MGISASPRRWQGVFERYLQDPSRFVDVNSGKDRNKAALMSGLLVTISKGHVKDSRCYWRDT